MNKKIESEQYFKIRQKLNKKIPFKYKRQSSLESKNFKIKNKLVPINPVESLNHISTNNFENNNIKSQLNILMINKNEKKMENKKISNKIKKLNHKRNDNFINIKTEKDLKVKGKNINNINMILENKEKGKVFNRKGSNSKFIISTSNSNSKSNRLIEYNNKKKNNLFRVKSGLYRINKKKLLNENKIVSEKIINNINNENNNKYKTNQLQNNTKRNTDIIIQIKNKDKIKLDKNNYNNKNEEKINTAIIKKGRNIINLNKNNKLNKINSNKKKIIMYKTDSNFKNELVTSIYIKNSISPISVINNNISNDIYILNINNNVEKSFDNRKKLDNNIDPKNCINNLNNTTSKMKIKANGFIENIEMDKDKEFLHLTENNSIMHSKSKIIINDLKKYSDSESKNQNIILSENRIKDKYLPTFIRKCGSTNDNKNTSFDKNKINEMAIKNIIECNQKKKFIIGQNEDQFDKTININDIYNKIKQQNLNKNEHINKKNTTNSNVESSFVTINFYNSNIDENNNNENSKNFVNGIKSYNYIINKNNNNNYENLFENNGLENSKNYLNKNNINNNSQNNCNIIKREKIPSIPIKECKNFSNNLLSNNYSNCNTGNTSNNNHNNNYIDIKIKENIEKGNKLSLKKIQNNNKECNNKNDNNNNNNNETFEQDLLQKIITNKNKINEKDLSLDKSTSLKFFPVVHEDFIDKEDEVIKLLNFQSPRELNNNNNILLNSNKEEESEIIFQNSDYSKDISLLLNNDYPKCNNLINGKNLYKNSFILNNNNIFTNSQNQNINIDNIGLKDTSIISNIGIKGSKSITQGGKERTGHRKKNQDFYIIEKNINNILGFNLYAILDGHGENGHLASQFASKHIIKKFTNITSKLNDAESIYNFFKKSDFQKIIDIFLEIDNQIINQNGFDISLSGTTCCLVIQLYDHIICSNIGDSRAILIFDDNKIFELSHDSKPEIPEETKRINMMGGVVDQVKNNDGERMGPYRVYIKNMDQPGLAMSRSFGDKKAKSCGVIPYPDIIEYTINNDSKYMVICSDGVWEFLSNEDVMEIGNKYYGQNNINEFCSQLLKKSTEMWEYEENYIDDITIIAVFF